MKNSVLCPYLSKSIQLIAASATVLMLAMAPARAAARLIVVAADGSGDVRTVQEAFAAVPDGSPERTIIHLKPGTYDGQKILTREKRNVTLRGERADTTILTWHINTNEAQPPGTDLRHKGTALVVLADGFRAEKLTFQNTSGDHGQALALRIDGDRAVVADSRLLGWQDTVMLNNGRHYIKDSYIEGRVDFIYGSATAVFERCEIKSKNGGYVTAASTPPERAFGFVFINSRLTSDPAPWVDPGGTHPVKAGAIPALAYLGRPWRPHGSVTFIDTDMGAHVHPAGWHNWGKPANEQTARYAEYNSRGPGAQAQARVGWSRQLDAGQAAHITAAKLLAGSDNWRPE